MPLIQPVPTEPEQRVKAVQGVGITALVLACLCIPATGLLLLGERVGLVGFALFGLFGLSVPVMFAFINIGYTRILPVPLKGQARTTSFIALVLVALQVIAIFYVGQSAMANQSGVLDPDWNQSGAGIYG